MATIDTDRSSGGNGFLYFAIGALIVGVAVLAWFTFRQDNSRTSADSAIENMATSVGNAADKIGDSAQDAARSLPTPAPSAPAPAPAPAPQPAAPPSN